MKRIIQNPFRIVAGLVTLFSAGSLLAQPTGQWDFNGANPLTATVGSDLQYVDGPGAATQTGTLIGTTTTLGIPNINGTVANVMRFPSCTNGTMGYLMPAPPAPTGTNGGSQVNNYTVLMDVLYPSASDQTIRPLLETDGGVLTADTD